MRGDLGAGKTTLVKGIAEGFHAASQDDVTSPTFTLIHEYRGPSATLYHIDLYRIDTPRELETLGLDDLIAENSVLLIEWGEKFPRFQREKDVEIAIERISENERKIKIADSLDALTVEYDATRLRPAEVEAALTGAGIPVQPE